MTPAVFISEDAAFVRRADGHIELYLRSVAVIDRLRTHHLELAGLPEETMRALWQQARRIIARADLTGVRELLESPYLFWIDGRTGQVLERWEAQDAWSTVKDQLREVRHAA